MNVAVLGARPRPTDRSGPRGIRAVRAAIAWLGSAMVWACGGGSDSEASTAPAYCSSDAACLSGMVCVEPSQARTRATTEASRRCSTACSADSDCDPELYAPYGTGVLCDEGWCYPFTCVSGAPQSWVGGDRYCDQGVLASCAGLDPRPCACGCSEDELCVGQVCEPKRATGEECSIDGACASGKCFGARAGAPGRCVNQDGEACTAHSDCEVSCSRGPDGAPVGYCTDSNCTCPAAQCNHLCAPGFVCVGAATCVRGCASDEDCAEWERCSLDSGAGRCEWLPAP